MFELAGIVSDLGIAEQQMPLFLWQQNVRVITEWCDQGHEGPNLVDRQMMRVYFAFHYFPGERDSLGQGFCAPEVKNVLAWMP